MLTNEQREDQKTKATSGHKASEAYETNVVKTTEKNITNSIPKININSGGSNHGGNHVQKTFPKTISFVRGKGNLRHNNRLFLAKNVDRERVEDNVVIKKESLEEAYEKNFGEAIEEYNANQKRKYLHKTVKSYMEEIAKNEKNSQRTKLFYEQVIQFGTMNDTGNITNPLEAERASQALMEYMQGFQERNPNLYVFNAVIHRDEATPHLHIDYIPVAREGAKRGLKTRNAFTQALKEQGIIPDTEQKENEFTAWRKREMEELKRIAEKHNIKVWEKHTEKRNNLTVEEYRELGRQATEQAKKEVQAELDEKDKKLAELVKSNEILQAKIQEQKQSPVAHQDEPTPDKNQKPVEKPEPKKEQPKQPEPVKVVEKPENKKKTEEPAKNEAVIRPVEPLKKADTITATPVKQEQPKVEDKQSEPDKTEQKPETVPGLSPEQKQLLEMQLKNLEDEKAQLLKIKEIKEARILEADATQAKIEQDIVILQAEKEGKTFFKGKVQKKIDAKIAAHKHNMKVIAQRNATIQQINEDIQKKNIAIEKIDRQLNPAKYLEKDKQKAIQAEKTKNITKFIDNTKARPAATLAKTIKPKAKTKTKGLSL